MAQQNTAQHEVELILSRQLSSYLAMPIVIVDTKGNAIYYNAAAEEIFGLRFDEYGPIPVEQWADIFHPTDRYGSAIPAASLPVIIALNQTRPARRSFWIQTQEKKRHIEVTAFPILGQSGRHLGAVAIMWEAGV